LLDADDRDAEADRGGQEYRSADRHEQHTEGHRLVEA
jgi:hypothetical protein